jgi:hypothetical protein
MKYVEFCAGIGGFRAGLDAAGWQCVLALDHDPDAVAVHKLAHGDAVLADVTSLAARDVPPADVWVAGFPCQPFSSSGTRLGFGHTSGHVFEHLARLAAECRPAVLLLENVEGLLTNKSGHTFAVVLSELTRLGYEVDWLVMDLRWFGVPQSRPRLFIVAAEKGTLQPRPIAQEQGDLLLDVPTPCSIFHAYLTTGDFALSARSQGEIAKLCSDLRPAVGKVPHRGPRFFGSLGRAAGSSYASFDVSVGLPTLAVGLLGSIVAPDFAGSPRIRSARYWSPAGGGGAQGLHVRGEPLAHCIGTSLGGAPLFAVPTDCLRHRHDREAFLEHSNWHREQDGLLVMRLRPERSMLLFGPHTGALSEAVARWDGGATRKFKLVGNMVAPICAREVARIVERQLRAVVGSAAPARSTGRRAPSDTASAGEENE